MTEKNEHVYPWSFHENFLTQAQADELLTFLSDPNNIQFEQHQVTVFDKTHDEPRKSLFVGDPGVSGYHYSQNKRQTHAWPSLVTQIKTQVETYLSQQQGREVKFNACLINYYRDGHDKIGWHSDDEKDLATSDIGSLSIGATRKFRLRKKHATKGYTEELKLTHGSLVLMTGDCQQKYKHCVPKELKVTQPRFNLTFRLIIM